MERVCHEADLTFKKYQEISSGWNKNITDSHWNPREEIKSISKSNSTGKYKSPNVFFSVWFKSEKSNSCKSMMVGKKCKKM